MQEAFLNDIFLRFEYKTYTPGETLVNFSDASDRLIILVSGKVHSLYTHRYALSVCLSVSQSVCLSVCLSPSLSLSGSLSLSHSLSLSLPLSISHSLALSRSRALSLSLARCLSFTRTLSHVRLIHLEATYTQCAYILYTFMHKRITWTGHGRV